MFVIFQVWHSSIHNRRRNRLHCQQMYSSCDKVKRYEVSVYSINSTCIIVNQYLTIIQYRKLMMWLITSEVLWSVKALFAKDVFVVCLSLYVLHMSKQHLTFLRQYVPGWIKHYHYPDCALFDSHSKVKVVYHSVIILVYWLACLKHLHSYC